MNTKHTIKEYQAKPILFTRAYRTDSSIITCKNDTTNLSRAYNII